MKKVLLLIIFLMSMNCSSQIVQNTNVKPKKEEKWALGTTFGYTAVVSPIIRNNFQLTMNLRYKVKQMTIGFQPGINLNYEAVIPDFRLGIRIQYDFLKW